MSNVRQERKERLASITLRIRQAADAYAGCPNAKAVRAKFKSLGLIKIPQRSDAYIEEGEVQEGYSKKECHVGGEYWDFEIGLLCDSDNPTRVDHVSLGISLRGELYFLVKKFPVAKNFTDEWGQGTFNGSDEVNKFLKLLPVLIESLMAVKANPADKAVVMKAGKILTIFAKIQGPNWG